MANDCDEELPRYTTVARKRDGESDDSFGVLDREIAEIAWWGDEEYEAKEWADELSAGRRSRGSLAWTEDEARV